MSDSPTDISLLTHILRLHDASPLLIAVFDEEDRLRYANPAFRQALGLQPDEFMTWQDLMRLNHRQKVGTHIETKDFEAWLASARSRRGKRPYRAFEADRTDGRWNLMTESLSPDGWMLCVAVDITDLRADERSLRADRDGAWRAARTDALTGVSNRLILENLRFLNDQNMRVVVQMPLIPGYNDSQDNLQAVFDLVKSLPSVEGLSLLAYHALGAAKYTRAGRSYQLTDLHTPPKEYLPEKMALAEQHGVKLVRFNG